MPSMTIEQSFRAPQGVQRPAHNITQDLKALQARTRPREHAAHRIHTRGLLDDGMQRCHNRFVKDVILSPQSNHARHLRLCSVWRKTGSEKHLKTASLHGRNGRGCDSVCYGSFCGVCGRADRNLSTRRRQDLHRSVDRAGSVSTR